MSFRIRIWALSTGISPPSQVLRKTKIRYMVVWPAAATSRKHPAQEAGLRATRPGKQLPTFA